MTSPHRSPRLLTQTEAERYRAQLRSDQAERDQTRLAEVRRRNRRNQWLENARAAALFAGIVTFFTWIYWMAIH